MQKRIKRIRLIALFLLVFGSLNAFAQFDKQGNGNPIVPGYFADPTIKKFGDTWYMYATTDGIRLASGDPQVWISKDFKNWYNYKFELPNLTTETVWAPEVVQGPDGRYYYYYSSCLGQVSGCNIYGYVSDTPIGPWESLTANGVPVIPVNFNEPVIPLDPNVFIDDDGSYYIYYCTWAIYSGNGVGWAKMNPDMKSFSAKGIIPNTQLPDVFEAPFMIKKDGIYYLTYSAGSTHDGTYRVMYGTSNSPTGTFTAGTTNPITKTNADETIEAPGHHCFFKDGDDYYIAYHRHDNPHSTGGLVRQVCVDQLTIADGTINKVNLTHSGIGYLGTNQVPFENLCFTKTTTASSYYTDEVHNYAYLPGNATDDNNGTIWKAGSANMGEWLQIDLGASQSIKRILTDFEYPIFYYQYKIEYSADGVNWTLFADKTGNKRGGSPMVDDGNVIARYLKITVTGVQKPGLLAAIWNVKVFNNISEFSPLENPVQNEGPSIVTRGSRLISVNAAGFSAGVNIETLANNSPIRGNFKATGEIKIEDVDGRRAFTFGGSDYFTLDMETPKNLTWNSPYSVSVWIYNPKISTSECIISWAPRGGPLGSYAAVNYGSHGDWGATAHWEYPDMPYRNLPEAGVWHHIAVTFDGGVERIYVDGELDNMEQKSLYVHSNGQVRIGYSGDNTEFLSASIASLEMYDYALSKTQIDELYNLSGCMPSTLFPQIQIENGTRIDAQKIAVPTGRKIRLYPKTLIDKEEGTWAWTGPNGFTSDSRELVLASITDNQFGEYILNFTNGCSLNSKQIFTIQKAATVLPDGFEECPQEATCEFFGRVNVAYGTGDTYFIVYNVDSFECSDSYFGDPAPGAEKNCFIEYTGKPFDGNIAIFAELSTSYVSPWETLEAINDTELPSSSTDRTYGIYGNWNSANSLQWVQYDWDKSYHINSTDVYWFTDNGGLLMPTEAYVEYWNGADWIRLNDIGRSANKFNSVSGKGIFTNSLRLNFKNTQQSVGIIEWRVYGVVNEEDIVTGLESGASNLFQIYPNPADSLVNIRFSESLAGKKVAITLLDLSGKQLFSKKGKVSRAFQIDLNGVSLIPATYVIKVEVDKKVYTQKLQIR